MFQDSTGPDGSVSKKLVLIVDDDSFSQAFFSEMLTALGISEIVSASNGRTALRTLNTLARPPDLLICDVFMPDMDGIEFLDQLAKKAYAGGVILVSGQDASMMEIALQVAQTNGQKLMGAYTKPVSMSVLAETIRRADSIPC